MLVDSGEFDGLPVDEAKKAIVEWLREQGPGAPAVSLPPARLELLAAALLGLPDPDRLLRRLRHRPRARRRAAGAAARGRGLPAEGRAAARLATRSGCTCRARGAAGRARARPTRWTPSSTRPGTSCATSTRTTTRRRSTGGSSTTGARRPVHRRHRPRDRPPALLALLRQGDERAGAGRLPRAVRSACSTRAGCGMGGTKMSKSKGNVDGPDELVGEYGADAVRLYILFIGPADQDMEWTEERDRGRSRGSCGGCGGSCTRSRAADGGRAGRRRPLARKAHETIAKVTDDIGRRFAFNTPIAAVMELVNELAREPVGAGRALRRRDGGLADPAVRAAHRRGAVGARWATSGCGRRRGRWPTRRCSSARRSSSSIQVNGRCATACEVSAELAGGRAGRAREGVRARAGAPGRQGDPAGDRRPGQARQPGRLATGEPARKVAARLFWFTRAPGWVGAWDGTAQERTELQHLRADSVPDSAHFRHEAVTHA